MSLPDSHRAACADCGAPLTGPYCAQCGQHGHVETPTLWEFVHEYLHHYVALEGKLVRSLWLLLRHPGRLTTEYLAGRRQRYVKPLQMYLTVSFVFFIALGLLRSEIRVNPEAGKALATETAAAKAAMREEIAATPAKEVPFRITTDSTNPYVRKWVAAMQIRQAEFEADQQGALNKLVRQALRYAPYGVFLLMPVFALLLKLLYWGRRMHYGAHLVFSLHVHTFAFIVLGVLLLPLPGSVSALLLMVGLPLYELLALRHVYGGRLRALLPRAAVLFFVYTMLTIFTMVGLLILAAANA